MAGMESARSWNRADDVIDHHPSGHAVLHGDFAIVGNPRTGSVVSLSDYFVARGAK